ncbi:hypothetical protein LZG04_18825 [Saccharothrix sp. S26]|uniref:hypothetical protein n=1 Tax=Saccharothrix sp. S26 TaxID=2907215 RepID=UPI001F1C226B|nr:hypothetical protein [Saccharothrix sp. S26]MCE6996843.1 hypothetical protein [Saccharothrix sp. S26]
MTAFVVLFVAAVVPLAPTEAVLITTACRAASGEVSVTAVAAAGCAPSDLVGRAAERRVVDDAAQAAAVA